MSGAVSHRVRNRLLALAVLLAAPLAASAAECDSWQSREPSWIWCDSFESDASLEANYFDVNRAGGRFGVSTDTAFEGSSALKATFTTGESESGNVKLSFGRTPVSPNLQPTRDFTEVYWRFYMKTSSSWIGNPQKLTRATIFAGSDWRQAAIGHLWDDSPTGLGLAIDPVSGVSGSTVLTVGYNDFDHFRWLGKRSGTTQVYSEEKRGKWQCIETRMTLNTPGQSNGTFAFWVDGHLEAESTGLDWRGSYTAYGINAIMLENYINAGAPQTQSRYVDNFVVSTTRIGCGTAVKPNPPTDVRVN